ncbi:SCP2 sterol-binding domain-containing protein [Candidatus Acetothermia bacterium]|nr:SCP2 sterol-binding domain-containing protein [Candidatus Acetothermia bacterium]
MPEIHEGWVNLGMIIGTHLENPKIDFWIDAREGKVEVHETSPGPESASLHLTCELFHKLYLGQENAVLAFVQRKIRTAGKVSGIIKLTSTMPSAIQAYKNYLSEKGLAA